MKMRQRKRLFWQKFIWWDGQLWAHWSHGMTFNNNGTSLPGRYKP